MLLHSLILENYRNLKQSPPNFCDGINVLYGSNAAGKTNTLEAIYLFATGKSFRTRNERDFISHGENFARAQIEFSDTLGKREMGITYAAAGTKTAKGMYVSGMPVDKVSEFLGNFRGVLFTPDHLELVKGAPEERRRLADIALCQIQPRFVKSLNEYTKVLAQRNNYLKGLKFGSKKPDMEYIDVLNRQLSESEAVVTRQRGLYCEKLSEYASKIYSLLTGEREMLFAKYKSSAVIEAGSFEEKTLSEAMYLIHTKDTEKDIELCKTSHGPHRDELMIYVAKQEIAKSYEEIADKALMSGEDFPYEFTARTFGSQGQQRSAVLAIKLAEGEIIKEKCHEYPVFLLDDLFGELDGNRRETLCTMLSERQCIITACDKSLVPRGSSVNVIGVKDGCFDNIGV